MPDSSSVIHIEAVLSEHPPTWGVPENQACVRKSLRTMPGIVPCILSCLSKVYQHTNRRPPRVKFDL